MRNEDKLKEYLINNSLSKETVEEIITLLFAVTRGFHLSYFNPYIKGYITAMPFVHHRIHPYSIFYDVGHWDGEISDREYGVILTINKSFGKIDLRKRSPMQTLLDKYRFLRENKKLKIKELEIAANKYIEDLENKDLLLICDEFLHTGLEQDETFESPLMKIIKEIEGLTD